MNLEQLLDFVSLLAPLSIVVAALALVNSYRQAEQRRRDEKVQRIRELVSELGTLAYVVKWASLGDSDVDIAVLRIRDDIQKRLGPTPTAEEIRTLMTDQRLREALVWDAFAASGSSERVVQQMKDFARLRARLQFFNNVVETAMDTIAACMRVRLMRSMFIVLGLRNPQHSLRSPGTTDVERSPLAHTHRVLRADAQQPRENGLSEALDVIEELGNFVLRAPDSAVLRLGAKAGPSRRLWSWLQRKRGARTENVKAADLRNRILTNFPDYAELLDPAISYVLAARNNLPTDQRQLVATNARFARLGGSAATQKLRDAVGKFLVVHFEEEEEEQSQLEALLELKAQGVEDPDIDLFLAAASGVHSLQESAISRGANSNVDILGVLRRHMGAPTGGAIPQESARG